MNSLKFFFLAGGLGCLFAGFRALSRGLKNKESVNLKTLFPGKNINQASAGLLLLLVGIILLVSWLFHNQRDQALAERQKRIELRKKERADPLHKLLDVF